MVTTERPIQKSKDGTKLRFHSHEQGKMAWLTWEDMSTAEKEQVRSEYPSFAAEHEGAAEPGRYANEIEYYEHRIGLLETMQKSSTEERQREKARSSIRQYRRGIEVLREAETIPDGSRAWFAVVPGELTLHVPPYFDNAFFEIEQPIVRLVRTVDHVYDTSDPIRIAYLRRMVREGSGGNNYQLYEVEVGQYPMLDDHGDLLGWVNADTYRNNEAARSARNAVVF